MDDETTKNDETYFDVLLGEMQTNNGFFDQKGMITKVFTLPSIEVILKTELVEKNTGADRKEKLKEVGEANVEKETVDRRITAANLDWNDEKEEAYLEQKLKEFRNVDVGVVSPIKKKKKINTKPLTSIQFKRNNILKKVLKNPGLKFLEDSPIHSMMCGLYQIYRILTMELHTCTMDSSNLDNLYLNQGVLNEKYRKAKRINIEKIPEITRNLARVKQKISILREFSERIEENITFFKGKIFLDMHRKPI